MEEANHSRIRNEHIHTYDANFETPILRTAPPIELRWIVTIDTETGKPIIIDENTGLVIEDENGAWGGRYGNKDGYHYIHNNKGSGGKWKGDDQSNGERKGSGGRY